MTEQGIAQWVKEIDGAAHLKVWRYQQDKVWVEWLSYPKLSLANAASAAIRQQNRRNAGELGQGCSLCHNRGTVLHDTEIRCVPCPYCVELREALPHLPKQVGY